MPPPTGPTRRAGGLSPATPGRPALCSPGHEVGRTGSYAGATRTHGGASRLPQGAAGALGPSPARPLHPSRGGPTQPRPCPGPPPVHCVGLRDGVGADGAPWPLGWGGADRVPWPPGPRPAHLQRDVGQDEMRQLPAHEPQAHDGLQLAQVGRVLQVEHGGCAVPGPVLPAEAPRLVVAHHGQVHLPHRAGVGSARLWGRGGPGPQAWTGRAPNRACPVPSPGRTSRLSSQGPERRAFASPRPRPRASAGGGGRG